MNPVRKFALYSGLCLVGLALTLGLVTTLILKAVHVRLEARATVEWVHHLTAQENILDLWREPTAVTDPARYAHALERLRLQPDLIHVKLWDREGRILWSDQERLIGQRFPGNPDVTRALAGEPEPELKLIPHTDPEYGGERVAWLLEIMVPVRASASGEILGAVEVEKDASRLLADIRRMQAVIWSVVLAGCGLLYVALLPIVRRTYRKQLALERRLRAHAEELEVQVRERIEQLTHLQALSRMVASSLDLEGVGREIVGAAVSLLPGAAARLWNVREEPEATLELFASLGLQDSRGGTVRFRQEEGLAGVAASTRRLVISRDLAQDPRFVNKEWAAKENLVSAILFPLVARDRVHGILAIFTREPHEFTEGEIGLFETLAAHAAIAIENARLYAETRRHAAELEEHVRQRTAALEEALRVKSQFLANMSHELRTPLNFVLGFAELLKDEVAGPLTPKQATYVDRICTGGKRLLELVASILDLTEAESGERPLHVEPVALAPLIQEVVQRFADLLAQKRLALTTSLAPGMPTIGADRTKLAQILAHLLANAIKFTPEGGTVRVTAHRVKWSSGQLVDSSGPIDGSTARPIDAPAEWLEIAIEDTGIGLKPEDLERIFELFAQVDASDTRRYGGAGVGLPLVRRLVELHGGRVWAESAGPGQGARFIVRLPQRERPSPRRLLLVEDEPLMAEPLARALETAGYAVQVAGTGREALARLTAGPPDLLVLDIGLPDRSGWDILRQVREAEATRRLPVLVLTGLGEASADQAQALGASEFLTKPFSLAVLLEVVGRLLARAPAPTAGPGEIERLTDGPRQPDVGLPG